MNFSDFLPASLEVTPFPGERGRKVSPHLDNRFVAAMPNALLPPINFTKNSCF
jgi:hypothetical protein